MPTPYSRIDARLRLATSSGDATGSVWLGGIDGSPRWAHDAHAPHYAASTMKLPLVIATFRKPAR